jgi:uncharacterized protein YceH (UPF0502 family)
MSTGTEAPASPAQPAWRPVTRVQRRVLGVLVEKAKTTPDAYPLTLNALTTGCNQKNNRAPLMNLTTDEAEQALEELRELGAVVEVQGSGRVPKFRHQMYEWLGVDKVELAVMAELLLRGEQTIGELRSHASRMEPIPGLTELQPILQSLTAKKLVLALTPPGRGQVVTHALYLPQELDHVRARVLTAGAAEAPATDEDAAAEPVRQARAGGNRESADDVRAELLALREEVAQLRQRLEQLERLVQ